MIITILIYAGVFFAIVGSIAAWLNTKMILEDLAKIKAKLDIKDIRVPSRFDDDLDKD